MLASLNGQVARSRCLGIGHATFVVVEADTFRHVQTVFARLGGTIVADRLEQIDLRTQTVAVM
ncbi:hypothetical protein [Azospirillum sp.]|uniref:hypothetical protein n=1 Tax=Azospirillum sp. TaxID=34012 RepID=UPI003D757FC0